MPYELVFKRYAPFEWFGGGFHGDNRNEPSLHASARTSARIEFDFAQGVISSVGSSGESYNRVAPNVRRTGTTNVSITNQSLSGGVLKFTAHSEGALPLIPMSPDIDTFVDVIARETASGVMMEGKVRGDSFPNAEVFLVNPQNARSIVLFHFETTGGRITGPVSRLPGAHSKNVLGNFEKSFSG